MLILSRKTNEQIHVGDDISITVVSVSGSRVKLGIDAPESVKIIRSELAQKQRPTSRLTDDGETAANATDSRR
ncbi:MAG: carbon storage regulator CsrA [Planctomycetales bacterium]|nr:carbon storage regulator CsrA [Planctomycetales bacterium]